VGNNRRIPKLFDFHFQGPIKHDLWQIDFEDIINQAKESVANINKELSSQQESQSFEHQTPTHTQHTRSSNSPLINSKDVLQIQVSKLTDRSKPSQAY